MSDKKQSPGDTIANHIAGLETQLRSEKIVNESLHEELHARAVELVNLGAEKRSKQIINDQLVETVTNLRSEMEGMRKTFQETGALIQEQHNHTRTELERIERELQAERDRPLGNTEFVLHLIVVNAANALYDYFNMQAVHAAFTQKRLTKLQASVLDENLLPPSNIFVPETLQKIVKVYCATTRTSFDTESLLSDVSNYIEQNRQAVLDLDASIDFRTLRESIQKDKNSERCMRQVVLSEACPEVINDLFNATDVDYFFERARCDEALIAAVREVAVMFIEDISFEIPISLE